MKTTLLCIVESGSTNLLISTEEMYFPILFILNFIDLVFGNKDEILGCLGCLSHQYQRLSWQCEVNCNFEKTSYGELTIEFLLGKNYAVTYFLL